MTEMYTGGGINWCWYAEIERTGATTCRLVREFRLHRFDIDQGANRHPETIGSYDILEQGSDKFGNMPEFGMPRIADRIVLNRDFDNPLTLDNPGPRFSHGK